MGEVSLVEVIECHLVNTFAPFVLCSELQKMMLRDPTVDHYIVNVCRARSQCGVYN